MSDAKRATRFGRREGGDERSWPSVRDVVRADGTDVGGRAAGRRMISQERKIRILRHESKHSVPTVRRRICESDRERSNLPCCEQMLRLGNRVTKVNAASPPSHPRSHLALNLNPDSALHSLAWSAASNDFAVGFPPDVGMCHRVRCPTSVHSLRLRYRANR